MASFKLMFVDCQSTGMSPATSHLIELGWRISSVTGAHMMDLSGAEFVIAPPQGVTVSNRILSLTGITKEELSQAEESSVAWEHLQNSLKRINAPVWAVAHFSRIEEHFLNRLWNDHAGEDFPVRFICLHALAKRLLPDLASFGLRALVGWAGETLGELKRAAAHVQATALVWNRLYVELQKIGISTPDEISEYLSTTRTKVRRGRPGGYRISDDKRLALPERPGVYRFLDNRGKVLYVGKATSLKSRVNSYFRGRFGPGARKREMLLQAWDIDVSEVSSALAAAVLEFDEIQRHDPPYNVLMRGTSRQVAWANRDFSGFVQKADVKHRWGPLFSAQLMNELTCLRDFDRTGDIASLQDVFWKLSDKQVFGDALYVVQSMAPLMDVSMENPRDMLVRGVQMWRDHRGRILDLMLARSIEEQPQESADAGEAEEKDQEFVWTTEMLVRRLQRFPLTAVRRLLRARWIVRFSESTVWWREAGSDVTLGLKIRSGDVFEELLPSGSVPESWRLPHSHRILNLDSLKVRRMSLVLQELRRVLRQGGHVEVSFAPRIRRVGPDLDHLLKLGFDRIPAWDEIYPPELAREQSEES